MVEARQGLAGITTVPNRVVEGDVWLKYTTWSLLAAERPGSRPGSTPRETVAGRSYSSVSRPVDRCSTASTSGITQGFPKEWREIRWGPRRGKRGWKSDE